jgi:ankyrin repeat protein
MMLLSLGADITLRTKNGTTVLMAAAESGSAALCSALLSKQGTRSRCFVFS